MLEALSQSLYDHILRVQGNAPAEFRHASREMYIRTLPQKALEGHGAEMIRQYIRRMNEDGRQDDHIRMACCYIATHLSEPFTLETVAKHVFVSKCYLCRMFRSQTGQSFSQYVTAQRLERAEHLLRHSGLSIHIERPARHGFDACVTLDEVYTVFVGYVHEILVQITNRPREPENNVNTVVLEYIEKNFCQNDICLSKIAEELSLSANLISRIVKEASHRSFSEYITYKRIQRSKELLADGSMSINAVS